jgi:segregation and condensation protein A
MEATPVYEVRLPIFRGPLDLLLHLIKQEELDITKVALAQVTDQYLAHIRLLQHLNLAELASFLVIAAKLLLIKSQVLLPQPTSLSQGDEVEEDVGDELVRQLIEYRHFKEIALLLQEREDLGLRTYTRLAPPPVLERRVDLSDVSLEDLVEAMRKALVAVGAEPEPSAESVSKIVSPVTVTIGQQMTFISQVLRHRRHISFQHLLSSASSRPEIIVTFLAILELIKQGVLEAYQECMFGDIILAEVQPATVATSERG